MENTIFSFGDIVKVLLPIASDGYDYIVPENIEVSVGDFVKVPLRNKYEIGVVLKKNDEPLSYDISKVKSIFSKVKNYKLSVSQIEFIKKVADYNLTNVGNILKMVMGFDELFDTVIPRKKKIEYNPTYVSPKLSDEQKNATEILSSKLDKGFSVTLLDGITGSGKTEVYFNVINEALKKPESQVLIMLPEISLTGQFLSKFQERFGILPVLWHSSVTKAQRRDNWKAVMNGDAKVIVGTRSSLFLPYKNLSLIVLDEEHDGSYKQEDGVIYQGRDMAVLKASVDKIPIILASATPSIETINNVNIGKYGIVKLTSRFGVAVMPEVDLIDMRQNQPVKESWGKSWLSSVLVKQIEEKLLNKEQVMLYINRRGYAPLVLCSECGNRLQCPHCNVYLTAHSKDDTKCCCHHCGYSRRLPKVCEKCGKEDTWVLVGPGIERIEEEVKNRFPNAKIETISSDIITSQTRLNEIIRKISASEVDIIIGTQILVKGHHFPNLTLVGVVDGDMSFSSSDLRANENTFQLLTQVSGRAGRDVKKGKVVIQTYNPDNSVMQAIKNNDRDSFVKQELKDRKDALMPPFTKLAAFILSSKNKQALENFCYVLKQKMPVGIDGIQTYGPIDSPLSYLKNNYRKRFLIVVDRKIHIQDILKKWLSMVIIPSSVKLKVDIDPYNFM
ncbi:MAG: primosomal protein N' [Alphaproteobacteria bacterium]|nr:primosomal protein N' [Alphaproteobacteria bacterium]